MMCVHHIDFSISVQVGISSVDVNSTLVITEHQISRSFVHIVSLHIDIWDGTLDIDNISESSGAEGAVDHQVLFIILQGNLIIFIIIQSDKIFIFTGGIDASYGVASLFPF